MNIYVFPVSLRLVFLVISMIGWFYAQAFTVILDAGHGGKDYGAKGISAYEKDINLAVSKLVAKFVDENYNDVDVLLTREDDTFLTLKERADFANKNGGDIFVSVHVNSADKRNPNRKTVKGASVYTLGLHKSDANFEVAKRENAVMSLENDYSSTYQGFDPNSSESYIIFEMSQNKHMGQSISLAQNIQQALIADAGRSDRGVRQAGFWVLWATGMPSVLIELDFICNPEQEKFMTSKKGQQKMASAIGKAIGEYISSHSSVEIPEVYVDIENVAEEEPAVSPAQPVVKEKEKPAASRNKSKTSFHVQILASAKAIKKNSSEFKGQKATEFREGKWYKYYIGDFKTRQDAAKLLAKVKKQFPDAFIIEMRDGKRVIK